MRQDFPLFPPGWELDHPFSAQSGIVAIPAGAGVGAVAQLLLVSRVIPSGARAYIQNISLRVVDTAAYDQLRFSLRHNGAKVFPWDSISGEQIVDDYIVPVETDIDPGVVDVSATNISGTAEAGAMPDPVAVRVIVRFRGYLLRPNVRRGVA